MRSALLAWGDEVSGWHAILVGMVSLAEFETAWGGMRRALADRGWTADDVQGLLDDWPSLDIGYVLDVAQDADLFTGMGASPAQARAWVREFYTVTDRGDLYLNDGATDRDAPEDPLLHLVRCYTQAACGDHDLALVAYRAGVTADELAKEVAASLAAIRERMAVLAGLRTMSGSVRS